MKVEISAHGKITIKAETEIEAFALDTIMDKCPSAEEFRDNVIIDSELETIKTK